MAGETAKNLYQRVSDIMRDLKPLEKSGRVNFGNTKYSYVTAEALFATLQKKMAEAGLVVVPMIDAVTASPGSDKVLLASMRFRLVNADNPAEFIEAPWHAQAPATDDKAVNKAGTSGEKYWLMKLFLISDEEDPDADARTAAEHSAEEQAKAAAKLARQEQKAQPKDTTARAVALQRAQDLLSRDPEAREKLPKPLEQQTDEEVQRTIAWLVGRTNAAKKGETFWTGPAPQQGAGQPPTKASAAPKPQAAKPATTPATTPEQQAQQAPEFTSNQVADLHIQLHDLMAEDAEGKARFLERVPEGVATLEPTRALEWRDWFQRRADGQSKKVVKA